MDFNKNKQNENIEDEQSFTASSIFLKTINSPDFLLPENVLNVSEIRNHNHFLYILKSVCASMTLGQLNNTLIDFKNLQRYESFFYQKNGNVKSLLVQYFEKNQDIDFINLLISNQNEIIRIRKETRKTYSKVFKLILCILFKKTNTESKDYIFSKIDKDLDPIFYYFLKLNSVQEKEILSKNTRNFQYINKIDANLFKTFMPSLTMVEIIDTMLNHNYLFKNEDILKDFFYRFESSSLKFKNFCKHVELTLGDRIQFLLNIYEQKTLKVLKHFDSKLFNQQDLTKLMRLDFKHFSLCINPSLELSILALKLEELEIERNVYLSQFTSASEDKKYLISSSDIQEAINKAIESKCSLYQYVTLVENKNHKETLELLMAKLDLKKMLNN